VTQGPQGFVRKAIVVAILFFLGKPDTLKRISRLVWRHTYLALFINYLIISVTTAMGNPGAATGLHYWVEGNGETTGRYLSYNLVAGEGVYIWLPVRYHHKEIPR
jgi:hypothetical protein